MLYKAGEVPGEYIVATPDDVLSEAELVAKRKFRRGLLIDSPFKSAEYLKNLYQQYEHEVFGMVLLDNQHRVITKVELFTGTIDGASVYPREVIKTTLANNGAAVILYHNHPSGVVTPSQSDKKITKRIQDALQAIEVRVLDHIIVGFEGTFSFAEEGLL